MLVALITRTVRIAISVVAVAAAGGGVVVVVITMISIAIPLLILQKTLDILALSLARFLALELSLRLVVLYVCWSLSGVPGDIVGCVCVCMHFRIWRFKMLGFRVYGDRLWHLYRGKLQGSCLGSQV